jgi:hypothetical protein
LFIYFGHGNMKDGTSTIVYRNAGITDKEFLEQVNALAGTNIAFISACGAGGFVSLAEKGAKENIAIATTSKNQDTGDAAGHSMLSLLRQCVRKKTHVADFFQRHPGIRAREPAFYCGKTAAKAFL